MSHNPLTPKLGDGCCATCGFLAHSVTFARNVINQGKIQTVTAGETHDVPIYMRASGDLFSGDRAFEEPAKTYWSWASPLCFIFAAEPSLAEEVGFDPEKVEALDRQVVATAIQRDRKCEKWFEWRPGISPAEHVRMRDMIELEKNRRDWEKTLEDDRKDWEDILEKDRRKFERSLSVAQIKAAVGTAVVSIFVAVILTYATIRFTQPKATPNPQPVIVVTPVTLRTP